MNFTLFKHKSVLFLIAAMGFFVLALIAFNYELVHKPNYATHDFLSSPIYRFKAKDPRIETVRLVLRQGSGPEYSSKKFPIILSTQSPDGKRIVQELQPRSASTGGGQRHYYTVNYGNVDVRNKELVISVAQDLDGLDEFTLHMKRNPSNLSVYLFTLAFLASLFASIRYRKRFLKSKLTWFFPYVTFFFAALLALTWNL